MIPHENTQLLKTLEKPSCPTQQNLSCMLSYLALGSRSHLLDMTLVVGQHTRDLDPVGEGGARVVAINFPEIDY